MKTRTPILVLIVAVVAAGLGWFAAKRTSSETKPATSAGRRILYYQSPMHPWITSDKAGRCTICGMNLEPVYEGQRGFSAAEGIVTLGSNSVQVVNVQTEIVTNRVLTRTLRVAGIIENDDTKHRRMSAYAEGRIEKLFVNYIGGEVTAGQPLAVFYSPSLLAVESEYLTVIKPGPPAEISDALRNERARLLEAAAQRLKRLGYSDAQLAALAKKDSADARTEILAPMTGTVVARNVYEGQYVKEGDVLFEIADFSTMWFQFDAYERDLGSLHVGRQVEITSPALPGTTLTAPITFIDPNLDGMTRSAKVRVNLANPIVEEEGRNKRLLYRRLYADGAVKIETPAVVTIPRTAVLSAAEPLVYVEVDSGAYEQRRVKLGRRGDEYVEVLDGVRTGERIVTTGNLLIDAQAQLDATARTVEGRAPRVPDQSHATNSQELGKPVSQTWTDAQSAVAKDFLAQASAVSGALAADNLTAFNEQAAKVHAAMPKLVEALEQQTTLRPALAKLETSGHLEKATTLDEARKEFVPFTTGVADLAQQLRARLSFDLKVYECPMADRAVKGAPKRVRWIQSEGPLRNPLFGAKMLDCGTEVK